MSTVEPGVRPREGDPLTVLVEANGVPFTHVATAGRVREATMMVPRRIGEAAWAVQDQGEAVVLFSLDGRLFSWPMRVEQILPSSYYLVGSQEPNIGERRQSVRVVVQLAVLLRLHGSGAQPWLEVAADLSATGFRVPCTLAADTDDLLDVTLRAGADAAEVTAMARVVRRLEGTDGPELACEFVELGSADEERVLQIVYLTRERALHERICRRNFT